MLNKQINNYFLVLFSSLPITIIIGSTASLLNVLIIDFSFILLILSLKDYDFLKTRPIKYLILLYFYLIFNSIISIDYEVGLARNLGFLRIIVLFAAFNYFFNQRLFLRNVFYVWSLVISIVIFDVFWESLMGHNIFGFGGGQYGKRIVSFFKDEPIVAGFINGFYLIIIGFLLQEFFKKKSFIIIISIIFLMAIFLTGERSNSIKALIGFLIFFSIFKEYNFKIKLILFTSLFVIFITLILNSQFLKLRFVNQTYKLFTSDFKYFKLYQSGFEVFKNHKLFGVGNKNYRVETCNLKADDKLTKKDYHCTTHPHQIYFELLSEHGILGTLLILFILYRLVFSKIKELLKSGNYIQIGSYIYLCLTFLPLLPSGSFFNNFMITLFMINLSILYATGDKLNIFKGR